MEKTIEQLRFLSPKEVTAIAKEYGTPAYVYDKVSLQNAARALTAIKAPFGITPRFAMKANPHKAILKLFEKESLYFDASSIYEVERAMLAGIPGEKILLTSQQVLSPEAIQRLHSLGVSYTATSLQQLKTFAEAVPRGTVSVRINPGVGIGETKRVNTGGHASSFGIWHEYLGEVKKIVTEYGLCVERVHTHIGNGGDPEMWKAIAVESISLLNEFPEAMVMNLGGGFKVARMQGEQHLSANVQEIGVAIAKELKRFHQKAGREIHLELEPGTFLTALAGSLITRVDDIVDTGPFGYTFIKLDTGMNDILRPGMYGAQHPVVVVPETEQHDEYVFVGHNCESGDIITPKKGDAEQVGPRLTSQPTIGSHVVIEGAGAYCSAMSASGYNSFPSAVEVMRNKDGSTEMVSRRGELSDLVKREQ
ncbi:diaminopimelate decarboxylase [Candidatus Kaiserbacteria bacterium CG10_big_fil_rev_8_21_14_0_10_45_20]|uniref:Diaminopimelate decarboxylase n=1 Tax=Candidatus Kaiserbacteria bacterium CG10_big_fil_rev_8_21_14_0_10_45_20 TaxID=1974607 RepID=A0A2H0UI66_9BACT|nr:MAG: diaminopimelate decarboxylase [Candidatus Kaiserbacteria bacterium CG10_big_fil_rev_8_21_14_0_10_45_20]